MLPFHTLFFVRTTNLLIAEGILSNKLKKNIEFFFCKKKINLREYFFKSLKLYKSWKKQTYLAAIKMQFVVTRVRKVSYCEGFVSDGVSKVSYCV